MTQQAFTGKTGDGFITLGGTINVIDVECIVTAMTSPKVKQNRTINGTTQLQFAGSYGLMYDGAHGNLVTMWHSIMFDHQDLTEANLIGASHFFWSLRPGVTATFYVNS